MRPEELASDAALADAPDNGAAPEVDEASAGAGEAVDQASEEPPSAEEPEAPRKRGRKTAAMADDKPTMTLAVMALKNALKGLADVVEARNTIPILSRVLLRAGADKLELLATDLDILCTRALPASITAPFETTIEASLLKQIVDSVDVEATIDMTLHVDKGRMECRVGRAVWRLSTLPADDMPIMAMGGGEHQFEVDAMLLQAMIDRVKSAIAYDETRYYLQGIFLHAAERRGNSGRDGELTLVLRGVATDGHRLSRYDIPLPDGAGALKGVILPVKAAKIIDTLCDGYAGKVDVAISDTKAQFDLGDTVLVTKLVDGSFPDYSRVIPSTNGRIATIDVGPLREALKHASLIASDKSRAVKLSFGRDSLTLSATSPETGDMQEDMACDYAAAPLQIGFNGKLLADVLKGMTNDRCIVEMDDAVAPVVLRDDDDDSPALFVLMPMRV